MAKKKQWKFPVSATIKDPAGKTVMSVVTQVYQIGIYVCAESNGGRDQQNLTPGQAIKYMKQCDQSNLNDGYTSVLGPEITVTEENGYYVKQ